MISRSLAVLFQIENIGIYTSKSSQAFFLAVYNVRVFDFNNNNNNNSEVLLGANIHRPDAPLASQEREESEN